MQILISLFCSNNLDCLVNSIHMKFSLVDVYEDIYWIWTQIILCSPLRSLCQVHRIILLVDRSWFLFVYMTYFGLSLEVGRYSSMMIIPAPFCPLRLWQQEHLRLGCWTHLLWHFIRNFHSLMWTHVATNVWKKQQPTCNTAGPYRKTN